MRSGPPSIDPDRLALYLTLGWTQSSTTWEGPGTERWVEILNGAPPEHWLPRSQWHCCWLLHDNEDAEHRAALRAALDEGEKDKKRPGLAKGLRPMLDPESVE